MLLQEQASASGGGCPYVAVGVSAEAVLLSTGREFTVSSSSVTARKLSPFHLGNYLSRNEAATCSHPPSLAASGSTVRKDTNRVGEDIGYGGRQPHDALSLPEACRICAYAWDGGCQPYFGRIS